MAVTPIKPLTLAYTAMEEERTRGGEAGAGPLRSRRPQPEDQVQISAQARALARNEPDPAAGPAQAAEGGAAQPPSPGLNLLA